MTRTFRVHYDGKVLVPEVPIDLPEHESLTVTVESSAILREEPTHGTVAYLLKHFTSGISDKDAELMRRAIDEADKSFEPSPDIKLD